MTDLQKPFGLIQPSSSQVSSVLGEKRPRKDFKEIFDAGIAECNEASLDVKKRKLFYEEALRNEEAARLKFFNSMGEHFDVSKKEPEK